MAKIAVKPEEPKLPIDTDPACKAPALRQLACGDGWTVHEVICSAGPSDEPFEERHTRSSIAIVVGGTFQYCSATGRELMAPGALLLGNSGDYFTCDHQHGTGDRCLSFSYAPEFLSRLAHDAAGGCSRFKVPRLPPLRALAPLVAGASSLLLRPDAGKWAEVGIQLAARVIQIERGVHGRRAGADSASLARVTRVVRMIENNEEISEDLTTLARIARLSPYHFLRTFQAITGTTPHQYLLRVRLRRAAIRLKVDAARISDIALDCGFGDISNFNRAFRAEFGVNPRRYRSTA